ncbi:MAG: hypothetical protein QOF27_887 [Gaiellaceae bacterium]|jgi:hypothetical protein|nr:hypothetical protein [Gaiellaceae bacterium]
MLVLAAPTLRELETGGPTGVLQEVRCASDLAPRRSLIVFQAAEGFRHEEALGQAPCLVCGYAETGHMG